MRTIMNKIITILVVLFSIQGVLAADPTPRRQIHHHHLVCLLMGIGCLFFLALLSGYYLSKNIYLQKKALYKSLFLFS